MTVGDAVVSYFLSDGEDLFSHINSYMFRLHKEAIVRDHVSEIQKGCHIAVAIHSTVTNYGRRCVWTDCCIVTYCRNTVEMTHNQIDRTP